MLFRSFPYSAEEGTPAALLPARVDPIEVTERARHLQRIQERITAERQVGRVGEVVDVLVHLCPSGVRHSG